MHGPLFCWGLVAFVPPFFSAPGALAADTKTYLYLNPGRLLQRRDSTVGSDGGRGHGAPPEHRLPVPDGPVLLADGPRGRADVDRAASVVGHDLLLRRPRRARPVPAARPRSRRHRHRRAIRRGAHLSTVALRAACARAALGAARPRGPRSPGSSCSRRTRFAGAVGAGPQRSRWCCCSSVRSTPARFSSSPSVHRVGAV